jgi:hypothetical protein
MASCSKKIKSKNQNLEIDNEELMKGKKILLILIFELLLLK